MLAGPIAIPLAVLGTLAGHAIGYRLAVPDAHHRAHILAQSGHGYLSYAPVAIGLCLGLVAVGFAAAVGAARARRGERLRVPAWVVAALPPATFVFQEFAERYGYHGTVAWGAVLEPSFLIGLLAQVPFAALAAAAAFLLGRAARRLGELLADATRPALGVVLAQPLVAVDLPRAPILARGYAGRGPPRPR